MELQFKNLKYGDYALVVNKFFTNVIHVVGYELGGVLIVEKYWFEANSYDKRFQFVKGHDDTLTYATDSIKQFLIDAREANEKESKKL